MRYQYFYVIIIVLIYYKLTLEKISNKSLSINEVSIFKIFLVTAIIFFLNLELSSVKILIAFAKYLIEFKSSF